MEVPNSADRKSTRVIPAASHRDATATSHLPVSAQVAVVSNDSARLRTIQELSLHSTLSIATIHRLKKAGRIPFFQPAGKGGRLLFPADAIERSCKANDEAAEAGPSPAVRDKRLSGPLPAWMR